MRRCGSWISVGCCTKKLSCSLLVARRLRLHARYQKWLDTEWRASHGFNNRSGQIVPNRMMPPRSFANREHSIGDNDRWVVWPRGNCLPGVIGEVRSHNRISNNDKCNDRKSSECRRATYFHHFS